jgi:DNA polymerase-1
MADLLLIDGHHLAFRCFYGISPLSRSDGFPTNAIHGWVRAFWNLQDLIRPSSVTVCFDRGRSDLRREILPDYKAQRAPMPDDLFRQMPLLRKVSKYLGAGCLEEEGVEADDLLASLAIREAAGGKSVAIASADKDFCQIVSEAITLWTPPSAHVRDWQPLGPGGVEEKFAVRPEQIVDFLSLTGDGVDNIGGVPGVGPKTAAKWLQRYGSIDGILAHSRELPGRFSSIGDQEPLLLRNQRLIRFDLSYAPHLPLPLPSLSPDWSALGDFLKTFELHALSRMLEIRRRSAATRQGEAPLQQAMLF